MKLFKILAVFGLLWVSSQTLTFAIHASQWKHPDNEEGIVILISDVHINADAHSPIREWDESQVRDLTQHLSADHNCVAIIEDYCRTIEERELFQTRFLPATTYILQKNDIKAYAVDFRKGCSERIYDEPWDTNKVITEETLLMNVYERIETRLPAQYQEDLKMLKNDIAQLISTFTSTFAQGDTNAKEQLKHDAFSIYCQLFDFVLLAEIDKYISDHDKVYVCAGYFHIEVLEKALQQAGYTRTAKTLRLPKAGMGLRNIQKVYYKTKINQNLSFAPIDLKKSLENLDKGISEYTPAFKSAAVAA